MKIFSAVFTTIIFLNLSLTAQVQAKEKFSVEANEKVDAKCFVELVGGGEMISFWNIPRKQLSQLSASIVGQRILLSNSKQRGQIFKSHQCVLESKEFSSNRAKLLDAKTPR